jgi:ABC-type Fe3+-citrate transport system substrate-binding protein
MQGMLIEVENNKNNDVEKWRKPKNWKKLNAIVVNQYYTLI